MTSTLKTYFKERLKDRSHFTSVENITKYLMSVFLS